MTLSNRAEIHPSELYKHLNLSVSTGCTSEFDFQRSGRCAIHRPALFKTLENKKYTIAIASARYNNREEAFGAIEFISYLQSTATVVSVKQVEIQQWQSLGASANKGNVISVQF